MSSLQDRLASVQQRIASAAARSGRTHGDVLLVAITKTESAETIRHAYDLGQRVFGENRVGEAEVKVPDLPTDVAWHMVGHIQSRKAKRAAVLFDVIHSVDSVKLAHRLDAARSDRSRPLPILLECNVSGEAAKYGFAADTYFQEGEQSSLLRAAIEEMAACSHLEICGLMTMAPIVAGPELARPVFRALWRLREDLASRFPQLNLVHLSMGMTDDFEVAIEEGATMVRVGRAIFSGATG